MAIELDGLYGITSGGNITTGNYFLGNGRYLTGINATTSYNDGNVIALMASGNVTIANIATVNTSALSATDLTVYGLSALTDVNATGNATIGNIFSNNYFYANGQPFISGSSGVVIGDQQIVGTGATTYSLNQSATTNSIVVSINGLTQLPVTSYTVAGNVITFSNAVTNTNVIDVRYFAASGGNSAIYGDANVAAFLPTYSGNLGTANTTPVRAIFTDGYYYANGTPFAGGGSGNYGNANVSAYLASGTNSADIVTTGNISANTFYLGNTPFTRTLTVGRSVTPVTVPLASNNSLNVLTASGNVVVYTT